MRRFANDKPYIAALIANLAAHLPRFVLLQTTSVYETAFTAALTAAFLAVAVVNPRQMRDFARATSRLTKTDALHTQILARFAQHVQPPARPLPYATTQ